MAAITPPVTPVRTRPATGAVPFAAAGALFVAYPVLRPWGDASPDGMAAAFGSPLWLAAHLSAAAAFVLVGFALLAARDRTRTRSSGIALGLWSAGAALALTYYGAETFALNALGQQVPDTGQLAALAEAVRMGPLQVTVFGVGLALMAVAAVVAALQVRPRWVGAPFALGMVLFLPQFYVGAELRIAHGVLLGAGCVLLAVRGARARQ